VQVVCLIISDVVGNDLGFISSGPAVRDLTTAQQCLDLLDRFGVTAAAPASVVQLLRDEAGLELAQFVKNGESFDRPGVAIVDKQQQRPSFPCDNAQNLIIGKSSNTSSVLY